MREIWKGNSVKKEENNGIIYESSRDGLINQMFQLQRLQEEGHNVDSLLEQTNEQLQSVIDTGKLQALRKELKEL